MDSIDTPAPTPASEQDQSLALLQGIQSQDPQVRKRVFTVLLRAIVSPKGPGR